MIPHDRHGNVLVPHDRYGNVLTALHSGENVRSILTDPLTPFMVQPIGQSGFGDPIFSDEFLDDELGPKWDPWYPNTPFWNATQPGGHKTNTDEPQGYDETGITFDEEGMIFTLRNENHAVPELPYTSGMVTSYPSFNPTYGYFEARMKLANVNGAWPAFWMDRTDQVWPPEIDWMENWGRPSFNTETSHTYHFPDGGGSSTTPYSWAGENLEDWHVYGGLWEPGRIRWYCDGNLAKDLVDERINDQPMYLICNLAGDKNEEAPVPEDLPFSIRVNYIRAWALPA
jgi:beta-glucanase (GH16 family)